jgi:hypothetical protein
MKIENSEVENKTKQNIPIDHFSIVNPKYNRSFYYFSKFYNFDDTITEGYDKNFLINQEKKFFQLIYNTQNKTKFLVWQK